jgi:tetratricopeptide (TPR) repeat protein
MNMDLSHADQARRDRKLKKAVELYQFALHENPSNAEALASLALTYVYLKENDAAFAKATEAIQLDPNQPLAHIALASFYFSKGQLEEYKEEVEKAFALQPFFYEVACTYAKMLLIDKKLDEAIPIFEKVIEANPKKVCPHSLLGWAYTSKNLYKDAYREYRKAFLVQPSFGTAFAVITGAINNFRPWSNLLGIGLLVIWLWAILVSKSVMTFTVILFMSGIPLIFGVRNIRGGKAVEAVVSIIIAIIGLLLFYIIYKMLK